MLSGIFQNKLAVDSAELTSAVFFCFCLLAITITPRSYAVWKMLPSWASDSSVGQTTYSIYILVEVKAGRWMINIRGCSCAAEECVCSGGALQSSQARFAHLFYKVRHLTGVQLKPSVTL